MSGPPSGDRFGGGARDKDAGSYGAGAEGKARGRKKKKVSYLTINKIDVVDYKDIPILRRFINDRGKILPSRQTGNTAKQQRMIATSIRRAREMALLPNVARDTSADRRDFSPRRERYQSDRQSSNENREPREPREPKTETPGE